MEEEPIDADAWANPDGYREYDLYTQDELEDDFDESE